MSSTLLHYTNIAHDNDNILYLIEKVNRTEKITNTDIANLNRFIFDSGGKCILNHVDKLLPDMIERYTTTTGFQPINMFYADKRLNDLASWLYNVNMNVIHNPLIHVISVIHHQSNLTETKISTHASEIIKQLKTAHRHINSMKRRAAEIVE